MIWGHKVRRRVSKKYLSLLVVGSISIYYFFLFMYYHLNKPIKVELVNNVNVILQQPKQHQDFKKFHDLQDDDGDKPQRLMEAPKVRYGNGILRIIRLMISYHNHESRINCQKIKGFIIVQFIMSRPNALKLIFKRGILK